ncbi:hypothetical protein [Streptomyces demainii]|uniref:hypothetical protein n=1 Tax=Streptomyces demainii TaxID=588122 RepID=UPI0027D924FA|nr:hypothetical protein [Streptomyces demainii]
MCVVPFGIDPPTGRIGWISRALSPSAGPRDLRDQLPGLGDDLLVTLPRDVPDPLRHGSHHLTRAGHHHRVVVGLSDYPTR